MNIYWTRRDRIGYRLIHEIILYEFAFALSEIYSSNLLFLLKELEYNHAFPFSFCRSNDRSKQHINKLGFWPILYRNLVRYVKTLSKMQPPK